MSSPAKPGLAASSKPRGICKRAALSWVQGDHPAAGNLGIWEFGTGAPTAPGSGATVSGDASGTPGLLSCGFPLSRARGAHQNSGFMSMYPEGKGKEISNTAEESRALGERQGWDVPVPELRLRGTWWQSQMGNLVAKPHRCFSALHIPV